MIIVEKNYIAVFSKRLLYGISNLLVASPFLKVVPLVHMCRRLRLLLMAKDRVLNFGLYEASEIKLQGIPKRFHSSFAPDFTD